jgi:hypothetical protein
MATRNTELEDHFEELYGMMSSSREVDNMRLFGAVMKKMMSDMIATHPTEAEEYIETLEAIKWNNYLTHKEAEKIIANMNPKAPWAWQDWVQAMNNLGLHGEEEPYYNSYALWVVMNMVYSDHAETLAKEVWSKSVKEIPAETWVETTYALALDKLKDKDRVFNVRKYFGV